MSDQPMSTKNDRKGCSKLLPIKRDKWDIRTKDGDLICEIYDNAGEEEAEEMIELIVRAVNSHDALIDALTACKTAMTISQWNQMLNNVETLGSKVENALKLAKEGM